MGNIIIDIVLISHDTVISIYLYYLILITVHQGRKSNYPNFAKEETEV